MDATVEVAVARQHGGGIQIPVDDFLLDLWVEGTGHAIAGSAGKGDHTEAELLEVFREAGFVQIQSDCLRARRQRGFHPGLSGQTQPVGIARQQSGRDHVARIAGVGATGDRSNDHSAIGHLPGNLLPGGGDAFCSQIGGGNACMRIGRAGHVAHHARQIESQCAFVLGVHQAVGPQAGVSCVGLDQPDLRIVAAGEFQVLDGLLVDEEHRSRGTVFRGHVRDGGAVSQRERRSALAAKLQISADHLFLAQKFGQREHDIGCSNALSRLATELDADDVRQTHPGCAPEHHVLGFEAADTDRNHAQCVDMRGVAVGAHASIWKGNALLNLNHRRHFFQIDLMHDPVARRDHIDVLECSLGPVDEMEPVFVSAIFDRAVFGKGIRVEAAALDGQRMIDDQLNRHHWIHLGRIAALICDRITQSGQIDQRSLAQDVVTDDPRRKPREVEIALALDELRKRGGEAGRIAFANEVFSQHTRGVGQ